MTTALLIAVLTVAGAAFTLLAHGLFEAIERADDRATGR